MQCLLRLLLFMCVSKSDAHHINLFKGLFDQTCSTTQQINFRSIESPIFDSDQCNQLSIKEVPHDYTIVDKKGYFFIHKTGLFSLTNSRKYLSEVQPITDIRTMINQFMWLNHGSSKSKHLTALVNRIYALYEIYIMPKNMEELNSIINIIMSAAHHDKVFGGSIVYCKVNKRIDWRRIASDMLLPTIVLYPIIAFCNLKLLLSTLNSLFVQHAIEGSGIVPRFSCALSPVLSIGQSDGSNKYQDTSIAYLYDQSCNKAFFNNGALKIRLSQKECKNIAEKLLFYDNNINNKDTPEQHDVQCVVNNKLHKWAHKILIRDFIHACCILDSPLKNLEYLLTLFLSGYDFKALSHQLPYLEQYLSDMQQHDNSKKVTLCQDIIKKFLNDKKVNQQYF